MRILADENVPGPVVAAMREHGWDVVWITEELASTADVDVLTLAQLEARLLVTLDTVFGALAFAAELPADSGIMLFRLDTSSPSALAMRVVATIESRDDWSGHLTVVESGRTRMRRLPQPSDS